MESPSRLIIMLNRAGDPDTSFKDDLGADSLDLFELVMALEDEYSVEIPAEELTDLTTVGSVIDYLKNKGVVAE